MACKNICRLCDKLIISTAVNFDGTNVIINLPAGTYMNGGKYCIVVAQSIPTSATISAPVLISITGSTLTYPLVRCNCQQATACNIRTRTKYSTIVVTNQTGGTFRLLGDVGCVGTENPAILPQGEVTAVNTLRAVKVASATTETKGGTK